MGLFSFVNVNQKTIYSSSDTASISINAQVFLYCWEGFFSTPYTILWMSMTLQSESSLLFKTFLI